MKRKYWFLAGLTIGFILSSGVLVQAAEPAASNIHVDITQNDIIVDGISVVFFNEQGEKCEPMLYQGTFYLPLRTAGEWMGAEVRWDQATMTAFLQTGGEPILRDNTDPTGQTPLTDPADIAEYRDRLENGVTARLSPDITVVVDGVEQSFTTQLLPPRPGHEIQTGSCTPLRCPGHRQHRLSGNHRCQPLQREGQTQHRDHSWEADRT